jgi:hypothetical protein
MTRPTFRARCERGISAAAVLVLVVVLGAGAAVAFVLLRKPNGRRVPVVGDSITVFAGHDIATALRPTYRAQIQAVIGQRIDQMLPTVRNDVAQHPYAIVVNLGTNDVLQARTRSGWRTSFNEMVAALAPVPCVELTTISTLVSAPTAEPVVASQINDAIASAIASHKNFHVVDWNAAVHEVNGTSLLIPDHVHPSASGDLRLAALTRHALDTDCPPPVRR